MAQQLLSLSARRVVTEIVHLSLPDYPALEAPTRAQVRSDVSDVVVAQIEAMPSFLGIPYRIALHAFRLLPLVRWGRPFLSLDSAAQRSWIALWADGIGPTRDFIKLIRSCALFAYFDHATLRQPLREQGTP